MINKNINQSSTRLYYTLEQAATELKCDAEYLLHLAATARIELVAALQENALVIERLFAMQMGSDALTHLNFENNEGEVISLPLDEGSEIAHIYLGVRFVGLDHKNCFSIECHGKTKLSIFNNMWGDVNFGHDTKFKFGLIPEIKKNYFSIKQVVRGLKSDIRSGKPPTIDISADRTSIFIIADELDRIKHSKPMSEEQLLRITPNQEKKVHKNAELNAIQREQILKVAIACKENYPDQCGTKGSTWAKCIYDKWQLFFPNELEPSTELTTIAGYLSKAMKLPE